MLNTPNWNAACKVSAPDLSNYADHIVKNCKLPDGKTATVYVFNNIYDQIKWQNQQSRKFDSEYQKKAKAEIASLEAKGLDASYWKWNPTGPIMPYYRAGFSIAQNYGEDVFKKMQLDNIPPVSYYSAQDLGELSTYLTTADSAAQACYEDSTGVYLLTICRPQYLNAKIVSKKMQKAHKDEFAYEIAFIPKEWYKIQSVVVPPAKVQPFNPSSVPDSDRNLVPATPSGNSVYYYDLNLAYQLQWLAVKIACKGVYDMAYTGDFRAKNPTDYYKTSFIKRYLVGNGGGASKGTTLFEGICFDYADFAYQEVKDNKKQYSNVANFWMVGTFSDSSDIIAYRLAEKGETSTMPINKTPVVVYNHNRIKAHRSATHHAWFWVQSTDGTIFWIDPTWTDNTGRPVYGIVRGGQEIELEPSPALCVK